MEMDEILGYEYCEQKKKYYCDKHEEEENVEYRKEFINKYFNYEKKYAPMGPFDQKWCCKIREWREGEIVRKHIYKFYKEWSKNARVSCWYSLYFFYSYLWKKIIHT